MVRYNNFSPVACYLLIAAILLFILLTPTIVLGQMGHDWGGKEGEIEAWFEEDSCTIAVKTVETPSHEWWLLNCRYEWWTRKDGVLKMGILGYIECEDQSVVHFKPPIEADSFVIRKRVFWHNSSGTKWRTTKEITVYTNCNNIVYDPGNTHSDKMMEDCTLKVETKIPAVIVVHGNAGVVEIIEIPPGVHEIDLGEYYWLTISLIYGDGYQKNYSCIK